MTLTLILEYEGRRIFSISTNQTAGSVDKSPHAGNLTQAVEILDADEAHENFAKTFSPSFLQDIGWYVLGEYEAVEAPRPDLLVSQNGLFGLYVVSIFVGPHVLLRIAEAVLGTLVIFTKSGYFSLLFASSNNEESKKSTMSRAAEVLSKVGNPGKNRTWDGAKTP